MNEAKLYKTNVKKPPPIHTAPARQLCPVCGKVSYSRSGEHPQCALARADAATRQARTAKRPVSGTTAAVQQAPPLQPESSKMQGSQSDVAITRQINQKLSARGFRAPYQVTVKTANGDVTLTGVVRYSHQKVSAVGAASGVSGVRTVRDRLTIKAVDKRVQPPQGSMSQAQKADEPGAEEVGKSLQRAIDKPLPPKGHQPRPSAEAVGAAAE